MSKQIEALKLALEALEHEADIGNDDAYKLERDAIKEALAQPEQEVDWEKLYRLEVKKKEALAAKYERDIKPLTKIVPMAQPDQEPVAWMYTSQWKGDEKFITRYQSELMTYKADKVWPLYTTSPPCQTCEALARTVMMDQTGRDA